MIDSPILVGDIVELSPSKLATLDDIDLERCTVLEHNAEERRAKLVFSNYNIQNETFFDNESTIGWFSDRRIINIERDYMVIEITDTQDSITGQEVCLVTMARVPKQVNHTAKGYQINTVIDETETENFIYIGLTAAELSELTGTIVRVSLAQYKIREAQIDFVPVVGWQPKHVVYDIEDLFTMFDLEYPGFN